MKISKWSRHSFRTLPTAVAIAILREQLFDIDVITRRTVIYAIVTALLLVIFFASVILLQQLFANLTGSGQNELVTVLSTLATAALFVPVRNHVQRLINRRFNRKKNDAQQVLARFGETVRDGAELSADVYALYTPFEVTRTWIHDDLYKADPELGNMQFLEAQSMAALHLRLRRELPDLPREHVFLHGSHNALSFIDVGRYWSGSDGKSHLSFISSNYGPLNAVGAEGAKDLMLEEICEYLFITPADIESWELNPNTGVPLFINTIGAWSNWPRPRTKIKNLYLAGELVKNAIDLACMESAVSAALEAAAQILTDHGESESLPVVQVPPI